MTTTLFAETTLDRGDSIHVVEGGEIEILGDAGSLWITEDHDVRDHFLKPGDRFGARAGRHTVVQALSKVRIRRRLPEEAIASTSHDDWSATPWWPDLRPVARDQLAASA